MRHSGRALCINGYSETRYVWHRQNAMGTSAVCVQLDVNSSAGSMQSLVRHGEAMEKNKQEPCGSSELPSIFFEVPDLVVVQTMIDWV